MQVKFELSPSCLPELIGGVTYLSPQWASLKSLWGLSFPPFSVTSESRTIQAKTNLRQTFTSRRTEVKVISWRIKLMTKVFTKWYNSVRIKKPVASYLGLLGYKAYRSSRGDELKGSNGNQQCCYKVKKFNLRSFLKWCYVGAFSMRGQEL